MKTKLMLLLLLITISCRKETIIQEPGLDLKEYPKEKLLEDFDLLVKSLKEAHTGLYWYSTEKQFDSIVQLQRKKITSHLNALEFYRIAAPVIAYTKEDHCDIYLDNTTAKAINKKGKFIPLEVISLKDGIYILNNPSTDIRVKGCKLIKVNGRPIEEIYATIFTTFAADGFIETSKYRYLDGASFALEYAKAIAMPTVYEFETYDPDANLAKQYTVNAVTIDSLAAIQRSLRKEGIFKNDTVPASFRLLDTATAILKVNTFSNSTYEEHNMNFKQFIQHSFDSIRKHGITNLILDMRDNGGGTEGNEDYLFSYFTDKAYNKYKYVQAPAYSFSFYEYTDYKDSEDRKELEEDLKKEHYTAQDGRILRKAGIQAPEPPRNDCFKGTIYILTSGWTYSGGAEFCSLMKEHTSAIFVGEESGGGFYGNTSGYIMELTLPNTGITVDLPLLKFVLNVSSKAPPGRGLIPDYTVTPSIEEFLKGQDIQTEFTKA